MYLLLPVAHKWKSFIETDKHVPFNTNFPKLENTFSKWNYLKNIKVAEIRLCCSHLLCRKTTLSGGLIYFRILWTFCELSLMELIKQSWLQVFRVIFHYLILISCLCNHFRFNEPGTPSKILCFNIKFNKISAIKTEKWHSKMNVSNLILDPRAVRSDHCQMNVLINNQWLVLMKYSRLGIWNLTTEWHFE